MHLRAVIRTPGVAGPFAAAMVARLPVTAIGLLLVLHVEGLTGRFAAAGAAAGAYSLGLGVSSPLLGRLIDRRGQPRVLASCAVVVSLALLAQAALPSGAPTAALIALAAAIGVAMPPLGSCLRAIWMQRMDPDRRHAAFALDSAAAELLYVLGPVVLAGGVGSWSTRAALAICAACVAAGTMAYVAQPAPRAWRGSASQAGRAGALAAPAVRTLLAVLLLLGSAFGAIEVGVAAIAEGAGTPSAAGPLLGAWGVGSMTGALIAARSAAPADPVRRLVALLVVFAVAHAPLLLTAEPLVLAPLLLVAGVSLAPTLTVIMALVGETAPEGTTTEAFTWASSGIAGGIASGAALGGVLAERGVHGPFVLALAVAVTAAALASARRPALAPASA